jgi:hypothetical protein
VLRLIDIENVDYALGMLRVGAQFRESMDHKFALCVNKGSTAGAIKRSTAEEMERNGLIQSRDNPADNNLRYFSLTDKGSRYLDRYPFTADQIDFISIDEFNDRCASV